ncbi:MAG: hypothetical protein J7L66_02850 [Anaerolineaceae bacterium]|nr:hypothetical protein [Anaerolineaceae bacterium]
MIIEMSRVEIIGVKKHLEHLVSLLHTCGCLQFQDIRDIPNTPLTPFTPSKKMMADREENDILIANINGLIKSFSQLNIAEESSPINIREQSYYRMKKDVAYITEQVQYLNSQIKTLQGDLATNSKYIEILKAMTPFIPESAKQPVNATIRALVRPFQPRIKTLLENQLKLLTHGKFQMITIKIQEESTAILGIFPRELIPQVEEFFKRKKITQLLLPEEYAYFSNSEVIEKIEKKMELNRKELINIDNRMRQIAKKWLSSLKIWQLLCKDKVDEYDSYQKIGETELTFAIFGWVPKDKIQYLKDSIGKKFSEEVIIKEISIPSEMRSIIPVKMKNKKIVLPFEHFVKLRSIPSYTDIDPSSLMALFMPIFFGVMVGDVGYGVIMLAISLLLGKKVKEGLLSDIMKFLQLGAIWTMAFGVAFGEYFGTLGENLGIPPLWMSRSEPSNVFPLIAMAITVGVIHITLGLLIGIWNEAKQKNWKHFLEHAGTLTAFISLLDLAASYTGVLPNSFLMPGWIVFGLGLISLAVSMGNTGFFLGPIEFVSLLGNILSYIRIAALGLASVYLAKVANDIGAKIPSLIVGILVASLIHIINIVIGILSPTIQSLRLHYVEFFQRFYEGGRSPFKPFKKRVTINIK